MRYRYHWNDHAVGTGLAGFDHGEVAPLFRGAPNNCIFPLEWAEYLED